MKQQTRFASVPEIQYPVSQHVRMQSKCRVRSTGSQPLAELVIIESVLRPSSSSCGTVIYHTLFPRSLILDGDARISQLSVQARD